MFNLFLITQPDSFAECSFIVYSGAIFENREEIPTSMINDEFGILSRLIKGANDIEHVIANISFVFDGTSVI